MAINIDGARSKVFIGLIASSRYQPQESVLHLFDKSGVLVLP